MLCLILCFKSPQVIKFLLQTLLKVSGADVGTTDELLNVFEDLRTNSRGVRMNPIPFIPPYTVAPDNLKVGTKATYRRVPR